MSPTQALRSLFSGWLGCLGLVAGCSADEANPVTDAGTPTRATFRPPNAPIEFKRVMLWNDVECPSPGNGLGASIAVPSSERVLVAGCDLLEVNSETLTVSTVEKGVTLVASHGDTIAVAGAKGLGLSLDGGRTFEWTEVGLVRCGDPPALAAGEGFAVVACIGGGGTWHGKGTTVQELPSVPAPLELITAARADDIIILANDGLFASRDSGTTVEALALNSTLELRGIDWLGLTETELLATAQGVLYAAPAGTGAFVQRAEALGRSLTYNEDILVRSSSDGTSVDVSADAGRTFVAVTNRDASVRFGSDSRYGAGYLYSVNAGTLLVGKVSE